MSDLQCPATLVFVVPSDDGDTAASAQVLRERRCAAVYSAETGDAIGTAETLAGDLGLDVRPEARLHPRQEEEQDADAVARVCTLLGEIADAHRGETVAVVAGAPLLQRALPTLAVNVPPSYGQRRPLSAGAAAELRVDADGWVLAAWNDRHLDESAD